MKKELDKYSGIDVYHGYDCSCTIDLKSIRKQAKKEERDKILGRLYVLLRRHRKTTTIVQANLYSFLEEEGFDLMRFKKKKHLGK